MASYRFPILLLQDFAGGHTATLVEDGGNIAAVGATRAEARDRLRDYLEKTYRNSPWYPRPEFDDPALQFQKVDVRAQYVASGRTYPSGETIGLRVAVVTGKGPGGMPVAALPTLGIRFTFYDRGDLRPLVTQYVQNELRGRTPAQVARFLLPPVVELDDIVISVAVDTAGARGDDASLEDLTAVADPLAAREVRGRYPRAWERDDVIGELSEALRRETAPILLLGEPGVGKTTVLADVARRIERESAEGTLRGAGGDDSGAVATHRGGRRVNRFWLTSAPRLIAGMQYLGMWQERLESVIAQTAAVAGVLCVENLLDLVRTGGRTAADSLAAYLVPYLQRSEVRLVAEATAAELDAVRRLLPGLAELFRVIRVPALGRARAVECLRQIAAAQQQQLKVTADRGLPETVYRLFSRFVPYQCFPGNSAGFVGELFDRAARADAARVTPADAIERFAARTGVPELFLRDEVPLDQATVVAALARDVIGQPKACRAAANVVTTFKAGLNDPNRPLGVLLFTGPTGVGKSQLAQSLAAFLYGAGERDETETRGVNDRLIRLDMSEYGGPGAAERFLGSPAGGGPAEWIRRVRRQPFAVLMLDEIEKAAPEIFDVLLGAFDEGRLTDPWGRLTHLTGAVIVMTSNLGAAAAGESFGLGRQVGAAYAETVAEFFRPEFYNRIDTVVAFDPLSAVAIREIAEKQLRSLDAREGLSRANVRLSWTDRLLDRLVRDGFDPRFGARPLERAIETLVVTPVSNYLVSHPAVRDVELTVDATEDGDVVVRAS